MKITNKHNELTDQTTSAITVTRVLICIPEAGVNGIAVRLFWYPPTDTV